MLTPQYIISQILCVLASATLASTYLTKSKVKILILSITATILFACEYILIQQWTAVLINFVGLVRCIWFYFNNKYNCKKDWLSLIILEVLCLTCGILTFDNFISILPIIAGVSITYGLWQSNIFIYRFCALTMDTCFLIYNSLLTPPLIMGIIIQSIIVCTGIYSIIRLTSEKNNKNKKL